MAPVLIGLRLNVCSIELSVYCGPHFVVCPYPEDTWVVHGISSLCNTGNLTLSKLSLFEPIWFQETASLSSKVRATSFILLLGVGSFVCYRLFHKLKRRLSKSGKRSSQPRALPAKFRKLSHSQKQYLEYLLYDRDDLSSISNSEFSDTSSSASYGDGESTSDTPSLSDGDSDSLVMGVSSSHPFEPVYFSKASGIHFQANGQKSGTQLDHLARNIERSNSSRKCHLLSSNELASSSLHKENVFTGSGSFTCSGSFQDYHQFENSSQFDSISYEVPFLSHDAASMHGNFSPGSLRERTRRTEQLLSSKLDCASKSSHHILKRDFSFDSLTYNSEHEYSGPASKRSLSRTLSIDSEVSELCVELQRHAEEAREMGIVTVEKMETLEDEINDIKQTVLELDADLVGLKVYKRPPANCWELTNISESERSADSEQNSSGLVDVIHHHKNKMWCKGFLNISNPGEPSVEKNGNVTTPQWDQVCDRMLDWDVSADNPFDVDQTGTDSGSDFGNSLETDSVDVESVSVNGAASESLEWDVNFVSEFGIHGHDDPDFGSKPRKAKHSSKSNTRKAVVHQSKSLHDELSHRCNFKKKHRSQSIPSDILSEQIQGALRKRKLVSQVAQLDLGLSQVGQMELGLTPLSSQLPSQMTSPMSDSKLDSSLYQDCATSRYSDLNCSAANAFKSEMSQDESGFLEVNLPQRTDPLNCPDFKEAKDDNISQERKESNGNLFSPLVKNVNRDSAYCEDSDFPEVVPVENVGPELEIQQYSRQEEWNENSQLSKHKKKAYSAVEEDLHLKHIRKIRADNYCVIRATLFQLFSEGLPILEHYGGAAAVYKLLSTWAKDSHPWLLDWTFAYNLPYNNNTCLQGFWDCLHSLEKMQSTLSEVTDKASHLASAMNANPDLDVQLLEAVKLLMYVSASRLHSGQALTTVSVPVSVMLLFSREDSPTPRELVLNRLNRVGHNQRLHQVEMYLLGYSLSVTLRVVHFNQFGNQEFISYYPDCNLGSWKEITLVAEDDMHFNVLTR